MNAGPTSTGVPVGAASTSSSVSTSTNVVVVSKDMWDSLTKKLDKLDLLEVVTEKLSNIEVKMKEYEVALDFQSASIEKLKQENEVLKNLVEVKGVESKILAERNEMYSRRESVRITGVEEKREEDVEEIVIGIGRKVGVEIERRDIAAAHRVGSRKDGKERQIIAKFVN